MEEAQQSNLHTTTDLITNPRFPQDLSHTRKLLHIQKYGQGLTVILSICCSHNSVSIELVTVLAWRTWSYILFKVSALILRVVERTQMRIWSQNIYILRLFKTSQAGSLRTELYQNGHRTSKKAAKLIWFIFSVLVCLLGNACMCLCLRVRVFGYSFESQMCPHKYSKTWLKLCLN